jgi:TolB protein
MSANGAGQTELGLSTEQVYAGSVRLSPERTRLVWTSARDGNLEIYAANVDGSGTVRLTSDPADDVSPSFRPCP